MLPASVFHRITGCKFTQNTEQSEVEGHSCTAYPYSTTAK